MNNEDVQLLYEYDRWANRRTLQAASALDAEAFTRDLGGSFRSVRDTLVHIFGGEWIWLTYWKMESHSFAALAELRTRRDGMFNPELFPSFESVQKKWTEVEKQQFDFLGSITSERLERKLPFRTTELKLVHLMQHMANHSTYHRGQISLMMRQLKAEPLATDFHVFMAEGR